MNTLSKLSFLSLALLLGACNEKVSPELQGAASSTTTSGGATIIPPDTFYFKLTNASDSMLNFKLHKTGTGNANSNCEISNTTGLSSDAYRGSPSTYDISCYMEADELAMHFNGFAFNIESSSNTCEYIGYAPFSFYDRMPGSSTGTYEFLNCEGFADTAFLVTNPAFVGRTCNSIKASSVPGGTEFPSEGFDTKDLCRFDYSQETGAPNCDVGEVTVVERVVTRLAGPDGTLGNADDVMSIISTPTINKCLGKITNCIQGPIKNEPTLSKNTSGIVITKSATNSAVSLNKSYAGLIGNYNSNRRYVNFRRDLASFDIEYGNSNKPLSSGYLSSFGDPLYSKSYNPELVMNYANNKRMDGTALVTTVPTLESGMYIASPYAAEPYIGLNGSRTNPLYMAYCLDSAFDVKARIKMVVRDWDRTLPSSSTSTYFERISDADLLPPFARQDVPYTDEVTGDPDSWNAFNDILDWDDTIEMERDDSGAPYDPTITIWRPLPDATYTDGFFNPAWFPVDTTTAE